MKKLLSEMKPANITESTTSGDEDVLDFWRHNASLGIYPVLCQLAEVHLSASASSVPVECLLNTTGLVANSKRCSLSAERLHCICFIHNNFKFSL